MKNWFVNINIKKAIRKGSAAHRVDSDAGSWSRVLLDCSSHSEGFRIFIFDSSKLADSIIFTV